MTINEELSLIEHHRKKVCYVCGRGSEETLLNLEATIHHNNRPRCLNLRACRRAQRENKRKSNGDLK